ncbi:MAG TPA: hypothetical protein VGE12_09545 [Noviherbaspirillum sp.]
MTNIAEVFNPVKATGSIAINIVGGVGVVIVLGIFAWLIGPLRWLLRSRTLKQLLDGRRFVFVFNPTHGQAKVVTFLSNGEVGEGKNSNEHTWRIRRGSLEVLAKDGKIYSRFTHDKKSGKLEHTNDPDTRSIHGQYMIPHFTPWPSIAEQDDPPDTGNDGGRR